MTDLEHLEKLYLPSRWSKRLAPDVIVEKHVEFAVKESEKARASIPSSLNIPYGSKEKEKIDIFGTDLENDAPVFAFVHGGYWQEQSLKRDTYHFLASNLYKNGIKSIFIGYELCPDISLPQIIEAIKTATRKCIDYAKQNKSKSLHLCGYSAGSHLVATLFTNFVMSLSEEDRLIIKSAILIAGIYDLCEIPKTSVNVMLELDEIEALKLSPYKQDIPKDIKTSFYVISAENDSPEFKKQSKEFHAKLQNLGLESKLFTVDNVDHFDVVELLVEEDFEITKFILQAINQH